MPLVEAEGRALALASLTATDQLRMSVCMYASLIYNHGVMLIVIQVPKVNAVGPAKLAA